MKNKENKWIWMPHPAHLIVARDCQFHLATYVGKYIVSTVGEWFPDSSVRKIFADSKGIEIKGRGDAWDADYMKKIGYEEIGAGRLYETMVFKARKSDKPCCLYVPSSFSDIDMDGYNDAKSAYKGHLKMCRKWSNRR